MDLKVLDLINELENLQKIRVGRFFRANERKIAYYNRKIAKLFEKAYYPSLGVEFKDLLKKKQKVYKLETLYNQIQLLSRLNSMLREEIQKNEFQNELLNRGMSFVEIRKQLFDNLNELIRYTQLTKKFDSALQKLIKPTQIKWDLPKEEYQQLLIYEEKMADLEQSVNEMARRTHLFNEQTSNKIIQNSENRGVMGRLARSKLAPLVLSLAVGATTLLATPKIPLAQEPNRPIIASNYNQQITQVISNSKEYIKKGHFQTALNIVEKELEKSPDNFRLLTQTGYISMESNNYNKAHRILEKAIELSPANYPDAYANMGALLSRMGKPKEALKNLQEAYNRNKNDPQTCLHYGMAFTGVGDYDKAYKYIEVAKNLFKNPIRKEEAQNYLNQLKPHTTQIISSAR